MVIKANPKPRVRKRNNTTVVEKSLVKKVVSMRAKPRTLPHKKIMFAGYDLLETASGNTEKLSELVENFVLEGDITANFHLAVLISGALTIRLNSFSWYKKMKSRANGEQTQRCIILEHFITAVNKRRSFYNKPYPPMYGD